MATPRIIVVGAGPAGVRAALTLVEAGLRPIVIDESPRDGGQIYRRQPDGFQRPKSALYGSETSRAEDLHRTFDQLKPAIDYRPSHLAWNVFDSQIHVVGNGRSSALSYDALIVASGATDRVMPVRGWHLAGTYSLGAAQIALKAQGAAIGHRVIFMGTGPLLHLVASQYAKAGANVVAVLDTSPFKAQIKALPKLLARPHVLMKGISLLAGLTFSGVPVRRGITPLDIHGDAETGVSGVTVRLASGAIRRFEADAVGLGSHLRPETQLADLAGCDFAFDDLTRQFRPVVDIDGRSSVAGVYLAGDGVLTQGADGAEVSGRLAAYAALRDLGLSVPDAPVDALRQDRRRMERFREGLAEAFPWPHALAADLPDDAVICRCEGILAGALREVARDKGADELNRAKAFSRVGMGRCQGRYCGHAAAEIVAAATNLPVKTIGRLRGQAPVKPLPISTRRTDT